jgi:autoinducer 2 (AI-2) kinase
MLNDWMTYRLCGALASEPSNATESMLFDLRGRAGSHEILDFFSIPPEILPAIRQPGERVGAVSAATAAVTGLAQGTPVFVGGADTQCGLLGAGALEPGDTAVVLGTTTPVQAVVGEATFDPQGVLWAGCHVVPERWVIESNAGDTGEAYKWLLDLVVHDEGDHYARGEQIARQHVDGATMMYAGPRIFDFAKIRPDRPGGILFPFPALHLRPSAGELVRAFLESVAFAVRANMEQIRAVTGHWPPHLIAGGGMSRNRLLLEILADVTAMPVQAAAEPESPALGVAMLVAHGIGMHPDVATAARHMGRQHTVKPTPQRIEICRGKYAKWRELHDAFDTVSL